MGLKLGVVFIVSLLGTLVVLPKMIPFLKKIKYGQSISEYSLDDFKQKKGTPTMGGLAFVIIPIIITLLFSDDLFNNYDLLLVIMAFFCYGIIGFIDDYIIVVKKNNDGLPAKVKFIMQLFLAFVFFLAYKENASTTVVIPFIEYSIDLGGLYFLLVLFMFTGASNAVNLTDGMDGLAAGTSLFALTPFVLFAAQSESTGIAVLIIAVIGSLLGYLKYNVYPAKIFMGDTGSLALGGLLAALAMVLKQEIALVVIGGVFVWETLCVIIQLLSVKFRKKKVFKYTPIHYSFTLSGHKETSVVLAFWGLGIVCAILGFVIGLV